MDGERIIEDASGNLVLLGSAEGSLTGEATVGSSTAFIAQLDAAGDVQWSKSVSSGDANGITVSTDGGLMPDGNYFVAGWGMGGVDENTALGLTDAFAGVYSSTGERVWLTQFTLPPDAAHVSSPSVSLTPSLYVNGAAPDESGNLYVVGQTDTDKDGTQLLLNNALHHSQTYVLGGFLTKLDTSGNVLWSTVEWDDVITNTRTIAKDVLVVPGNDSVEGQNIYVLGSTTGSLWGNTVHGLKDIYLEKFHIFPNGTVVGSTTISESSMAQFAWLHQYGSGLGPTDPTAFYVDSSSNVFITGSTSAPLMNVPIVGQVSCFVMALKPDGTVGPYTDITQNWVQMIGAINNVDQLGSTYCSQITGDADGNLYVAGTTNGQFGDSPITFSKNYFVAKLDSSGTLLWLHQYGVDSKDTFGRGLGLSATGDIFTVGQTSGNLEDLLLTGVSDIFVSKFDTDGVLQ